MQSNTIRIWRCLVSYHSNSIWLVKVLSNALGASLTPKTSWPVLVFERGSVADSQETASNVFSKVASYQFLTKSTAISSPYDRFASHNKYYNAGKCCRPLGSDRERARRVKEFPCPFLFLCHILVTNIKFNFHKTVRWTVGY